jgi:hypothetical protein
MQENISNTVEDKFKEEMDKTKQNAGEEIDKSKLESEDACEIIVGKDQEDICKVKS